MSSDADRRRIAALQRTTRWGHNPTGHKPTFSAMVAPLVDQLPTDRAVGRCQLPDRLQAFRSRASDGTSTYTREASMGQTRKLPAEAVELYTRFIHGEIS